METQYNRVKIADYVIFGPTSMFVKDTKPVEAPVPASMGQCKITLVH